MTETYVSSHDKDDASVLAMRGFTADRARGWIGGGKCLKFDGAIPPEKALLLIKRCEAEIWDSEAINPETGERVQDASRKQIITRRDGKPVVQYVSSDRFVTHDLGAFYDRIEQVRQSSPGIGWASVVTTNWGAKVIAQLEQEDVSSSPTYGVKFKPTMTNTIGHDGQTPTSHFGGFAPMSCDNQMHQLLKLVQGLKDGDDGTVKVRHTRWSNNKLEDLDVQACLATIADAMGGLIDKFIDVPMSDSQFERFVEKVAPYPAVKEGEELSKAAKTRADNIRQDIWRIYRKEDRTGGFQRTAWGAFQSVNTYTQHERAARGQTNEARRWNEYATGKSNELATVNLLDQVLNQALTRSLVAA